MKLAVLQMSDTPQIESSAVMLRHAGYDVRVCSAELVRELQKMCLEVVVQVESAYGYGCDELDPTIGRATVADMDRADLYCDIKVNNFARVWERWPRLRDRSAFWRVNGGIPEHVVRTRNGKREDCGDERNPPCPAITANFWYSSAACAGRDRNYTFWPPYPRMGDFDPARRFVGDRPFEPPICLCHSVRGWGFGAIVDRCRDMGVRFHGVGSPNDKLQHSQVPTALAEALCMVHVKSSDCPGWALYEGFLAACPVVVAQWLVRMGGMDALFENGVTCVTYGVDCDETGRGDPQYDRCVDEIRAAIAMFRADPARAREIGLAGRKRLVELMWNPERDGPGFREYLARTFR